MNLPVLFVLAGQAAPAVAAPETILAHANARLRK
jgi:hypothetical protein